MEITRSPLAGLAACTAPITSNDTAQDAAAIACEELATASLPNTMITLAERVPAGAFVPPTPEPLPPNIPPPAYDQLPAFCRVGATISPGPDSEIKFEVWMPADGWNDKFVGTGNGGMRGAILHWAMTDPLARGYATANTNTGHDTG